MSLCWSGSQLGSLRISHRAEARCGRFAACYPKERLAFGTGRLVLLNSIRTVRREVDSPFARVIPMSHVMAPSLTPAMPRAPACECAEPSASQAWRWTSPRPTVRSRAKSLPLQSSRARPVLCCLVVPGRGGEPSPGRLSGRGRERDGHPGPAVGGTRERGAAAESPRCKRRLSSVVNWAEFGDDGISIPRKTASNYPLAARRAGHCPADPDRSVDSVFARRRYSVGGEVPDSSARGSGIMSRRCRLFARPTRALQGSCR